MAKWLKAQCPQCGPFWAQETRERKIERCSKCSGPLSGPPTNLAYSDDELDEVEGISDEFSDFEQYCRRQLTGSKEIRRPTSDEISDHTDYAALEVLSMHDHIKSIFDHYRKQKVLPFDRKQDPHNRAWREFWKEEYERLAMGFLFFLRALLVPYGQRRTAYDMPALQPGHQIHAICRSKRAGDGRRRI
jgi:hypothetical protein